MGRYARSVWHTCVGRRGENPVVVDHPTASACRPGVRVLEVFEDIEK
jgi:hypothetical protein